MAPGSYQFNGPVFNDPTNPQSGDLDGDFQGLPVFVRQPNGMIKENVLYNWTSTPLERLSGFANGHFDLTDSVTVTGQAMVTRTKTESSLGLAAANINQWGAGIPFGNQPYLGNSNTYFDIPNPLQANGTTHPSYTPTGRFGVDCDSAPTPQKPWLDGLPGCTKSEAFPVPAEVYNLMMTRPRPEEMLWMSREPDWMRSALGAGRSTDNITQTMSFTVGLEVTCRRRLPGMSLYTTVGQHGRSSARCGHQYRDVPHPRTGGTRASTRTRGVRRLRRGPPTCTSGLPLATTAVSQDCLQMISPELKNQREMTQTILEANLVGDLAEMSSGTLQYAAGYTYRENGFDWALDNLSDINNITDPIAGLFPGETSGGKFDVSELYGELLIPIISDGPIGVEHFNVEIGARISDWSMENMPNLETYKALFDWAVSPRYRLRGGFNRAFRAPNLGELYSRRAQLFGAGGATRDWCSETSPGTFSATPGAASRAQGAPDRRSAEPDGRGWAGGYTTTARSPTAHSRRPRRSLTSAMALREEQADAWTIGVALKSSRTGGHRRLVPDQIETVATEVWTTTSATSTWHSSRRATTAGLWLIAESNNGGTAMRIGRSNGDS
jgi:hypothetical protein